MFAFYVSLEAIFWIALWLPLFLFDTYLYFPASFPSGRDSWLIALSIIAGLIVANGFFEHPFHRWWLHSRSLIGNAHSRHHWLTRGKRYAIVSAEQKKSANFPPWALPAFFGVYGVFLTPLQAAFPKYPLLFSAAIAVSYTFLVYEVKHSILHLPFDPFWRVWISIWGRNGSLVKDLLSHIRHHENPMSNLHIAGCGPGRFLSNLADSLLGTEDEKYRDISPAGELVPKTDYTKPKIGRLIRWGDWLFFGKKIQITTA